MMYNVEEGFKGRVDRLGKKREGKSMAGYG